jgi:Contractile injection system tape measure protein
MTAQRHIIKRQVLELQISSMADAQQLQTEVSRIYRQRIVPLIDRYCSELSAPECIHRIDALELNLGTVHPQHLEEDLIAKVRAQLRTLLAEQITADEHRAEGAGGNRKTASHLELFGVFAQTGSVPWWTDASPPHLLDDCLQYLIHHAPGPLRQLMRELAQDQRPLQRIVHHYADRLLAALTAVLAPALALQALAHMVRDLVLLLQSTTIGAGQEQARLRHLVWGVIMQQVSLRGEQETAWPPFFQAVLIRVAVELGVAYTVLLAGMHQVVPQDHARFQSPLGEIAETLYTEFLQMHGLPLPSAEEEQGEGVLQPGGAGGRYRPPGKQGEGPGGRSRTAPRAPLSAGAPAPPPDARATLARRTGTDRAGWSRTGARPDAHGDLAGGAPPGSLGACERGSS